jgi:hypothetical protein
LEVSSRRGPRELELDTPTFDDPLPGTWQKKWPKLEPKNIESNWVHRTKQQFQITANPQILDFKLQTLLLSKIPIQSRARVQCFLLGFEVHSLVSRCYKIYCELKKHMRGCSYLYMRVKRNWNLVKCKALGGGRPLSPWRRVKPWRSASLEYVTCLRVLFPVHFLVTHSYCKAFIAIHTAKLVRLSYVEWCVQITKR